MEEFGPGKREFIFCPNGEAVYYKKSWHHASEFFANPPGLRDKRIRFKLCPAHEMQKNKQYEGEIIIKNVSVKFRKDLVRLVENMGTTAMRIDVLDRILDLKFRINELRITTSENQLAQKIAKKVQSSFKNKIRIKILRGKGSDVVRISIAFV